MRERWHNQLDPNIRKDPWTPEEDQRLLMAYQVLTILTFRKVCTTDKHHYLSDWAVDGLRSVNFFLVAQTTRSRTGGMAMYGRVLGPWKSRSGLSHI